MFTSSQAVAIAFGHALSSPVESRNMADSSTVALAAGATLVAAAFTVAIGDRWATRRRPHELAWTVSLALFTFASAALWVGVATGWTAGSFRAFYLFGAILNVPWLALGSVLLLNGGKRAAGLLRGLASGRHSSPGLMIYAPLKAKVPSDDLPVGKDLFGVLPRVLAAAGSGVAATVIVVLALWSAWRLRRGRSHGTGRRVGVCRTTRARQRADRSRHCRAFGQRHRRRTSRENQRLRHHPRARHRHAVRRLRRCHRQPRHRHPITTPRCDAIGLSRELNGLLLPDCEAFDLVLVHCVNERTRFGANIRDGWRLSRKRAAIAALLRFWLQRQKQRAACCLTA